MKIKIPYLKIATLCSLFAITQVQANKELNESEILTVTCPNKVDTRILSFNPIKNRWCDATLNDFCKTRQLDAARLACSVGYSKALRKLPIEPAPKALVVNLKAPDDNLTNDDQKRLQLENELLDIQEKLLDIKRQQIELDKEEIRIRGL